MHVNQHDRVLYIIHLFRCVHKIKTTKINTIRNLPIIGWLHKRIRTCSSKGHARKQRNVVKGQNRGLLFS